MVKTNMGAIQTIELSNNDCGLEAKRLLGELEIVMYAFDIEMVEMGFEEKRFLKEQAEH